MRFKMIWVAMFALFVSSVAYAGDYKIELVKGEVKITAANGAALEVKVGQTVDAEATVKTGADSEIELTAPKSLPLKIGPNQSKKIKDAAAEHEKIWTRSIWEKVALFVKDPGKNDGTANTAAMRGELLEQVKTKWKDSNSAQQSPDQALIKTAISYFEKMADSSTNNDTRQEALYLLGGCHEKLGQSDKAKNAYKKLIEIDPNSEWAKRVKSKLD